MPPAHHLRAIRRASLPVVSSWATQPVLGEVSANGVARRPTTPSAIHDMREAVETFADADRMRRDAEFAADHLKHGALELLSSALPPLGAAVMMDGTATTRPRSSSAATADQLRAGAPRR